MTLQVINCAQGVLVRFNSFITAIPKEKTRLGVPAIEQVRQAEYIDFLGMYVIMFAKQTKEVFIWNMHSKL